MIRFAILLVAMAFASQAAFAAGPEKLADPKLEMRAAALQKELRCLVCQGESLDQSNAPLAADLRALIRERIAAGDSDKQVTDFLVARYGNFILLKPPVEPDTFVLWFAPIAVLMLGGTAVAFILLRARKRFLADGNS